MDKCFPIHLTMKKLRTFYFLCYDCQLTYTIAFTEYATNLSIFMSCHVRKISLVRTFSLSYGIDLDVYIPILVHRLYIQLLQEHLKSTQQQDTVLPGNSSQNATHSLKSHLSAPNLPATVSTASNSGNTHSKSELKSILKTGASPTHSRHVRFNLSAIDDHHTRMLENPLPPLRKRMFVDPRHPHPSTLKFYRL